MDTQLIKEVANHCGGTFLPILSCVHVYTTPGGNRLQVGNGRYSVDVPTDLPEMTVDGGRLVAALAACKEQPVFTVTESNVNVKAGRVRARIARNPTEYPLVQPVPIGDTHITDVGDVLGRLEPFAAEDASRPWATSICLSGGFAYATNNVALVRCPLPVPVPLPVNIPATVVPAVVQRGPVVDIGCDGNAVTFYYADSSWVRTSLIEGEWPTHVVDNFVGPLTDEWEMVHESLAGLLATAAKVSADKHPVVEFTGVGFRLLDDSFAVDDLGVLPEAGRVAAKMTSLVMGVADSVQWHTPRQDVHAFRKDDLIGIIGGTK